MRAFFGVVLGLGASICAALPAAGQRAEVAKVGVLSLHSLEQESAIGTGASAFRAGMQRLGYREGQNLLVNARHADGDPARLRVLAAELVSCGSKCSLQSGQTLPRRREKSRPQYPS